jgi:fructose-1,6-bisphosphatase/inositol monophosphatase family enzyme
MLPDAQQVIQVMREVATTLITPRFRQLRDDEIKEKNPGDFVTIADLEAEKYLKGKLTALVPGSLVVGEEEAEVSPEILKRLNGDAPVWVLDPLDGTGNFAHGKEPFAVIVAYCQGGETLMGWIHDPLTGETVWAAKGQGCWAGDKRLKLPVSPLLKDMKGSLGKSHAKRLKAVQGGPQSARRLGCVGRDYMDLALGKIEFARYALCLKPWDHAAGVLLHTEAGGYNHLIKAGRSYHPDLIPAQAVENDEILMLAPDMQTIEVITFMLKKYTTSTM